MRSVDVDLREEDDLRLGRHWLRRPNVSFSQLLLDANVCAVLVGRELRDALKLVARNLLALGGTSRRCDGAGHHQRKKAHPSHYCT